MSGADRREKHGFLHVCDRRAAKMHTGAVAVKACRADSQLYCKRDRTEAREWLTAF